MIEALEKAKDAFIQNGPHARDYYVQGDGAPSQAQKEHVDRVVKLGDMIREMHEIAENILMQPNWNGKD
jgi:hypothetical protein